MASTRRAGRSGPRVRIASLLIGGFAAVAAPTSAQPPPAGAEFQVNTYTTAGQFRPAVASDADGDVVVVWASVGSVGNDSSQASIQGQRYTVDGQPASGQFQINAYTTGQQNHPDVASSPVGDFVVVWTSPGSPGSDQDGSVQGRLFFADGTPRGAEFQVNTYTTGNVRYPRVDADASGSFVVVWGGMGSSGTDNSLYSVQARRFAADGTPLGPQFQVNTYTTGQQWVADVAVDATGRFVVAWQSFGSSGSDQSGYSVQARRYAADGSPQGVEFQVNTYTTGAQQYPGVECDADRDFVVTWTSDGSAGGDVDGFSVQARRFDQNGTPQGGEFQVNVYTTSFQSESEVAVDASGDFVITWNSDGSGRTDTDGYSVHGRWYRQDGTALGTQLQINAYSTGAQWRSAVAVDSSGNAFVVWDSDGSFGSDTSSKSVQARRYDGLFRDGFETGDASRWTSSVP